MLYSFLFYMRFYFYVIYYVIFPPAFFEAFLSHDFEYVPDVQISLAIFPTLLKKPVEKIGIKFAVEVKN